MNKILKIGKRQYILTEPKNRGGYYPEANFNKTGMALIGILPEGADVKSG